MKTKLLITGLAFVAMTTLASSQNNVAGQSQLNVTGRGSAYVDTNNNDICDNYENRVSNAPGGNRNLYCVFNGQEQSGQGQGQRLRFRNSMGHGQRMGNGMAGGETETLLILIIMGYVTFVKHPQKSRSPLAEKVLYLMYTKIRRYWNKRGIFTTASFLIQLSSILTYKYFSVALF
jgi:hypothetical protein